MSGPTLERLDERTTNHAADIAALQGEVKALWRIVYWGSGVCVGFGAVAALLVPKLAKLLGLS